MNSIPFSEKRYQIISTLGKGGMATVFLAKDLQLGRQVAIKVIHSEISTDKTLVQRTLREGKILATLSHHSIATIYEMTISKGRPYIVQKYIKGYDLRSILNKGKILKKSAALKLMYEQASALKYIHNSGIVHRDIKPENIMINSSGQSLLMDFGLALSYEQTRMTSEGTLLGTLQYLAPEVIKGNEADPASDIFQLALVFFELLTGKNLYGKFSTFNELLSIVKSSKWENNVLPQTFPKSLIPLLRACTQANKDNRIKNGEELCDYLNKNCSHLRKDETSNKKGPPHQIQLNEIPEIKVIDGAMPEVASFLPPRNVKIRFMFITLAIAIVGLLYLYNQYSDSNSASQRMTSYTGTNHSKTLNKLTLQARTWLLFPDGFFLFLKSNAGNQLHWKLTKTSNTMKGIENPAERNKSQQENTPFASGKFERVAGGWNAFHQFPVNSSQKLQSVILSIFDNQKLIGQGQLAFPQTILQSPFEMTLSYETINCSWKFYGKTKANIIFEELNSDLSVKKSITISDLTNEYKATLSKLGLRGHIRGTLVIPAINNTMAKKKNSQSDNNKSSFYIGKKTTFSKSGSLVIATTEGISDFTLKGAFPWEKKLERNRTQFALNQLIAKKKGTKIIGTVFNDNYLYVLTEAGNLHYMEVSNNYGSLYKKLWTFSLKTIVKSCPDYLESTDSKTYSGNNILMQKKGNAVAICGCGNLTRIYTIDPQRQILTEKIPISDDSQILRMQFVATTVNSRLLSCRHKDRRQFYLWNEQESCKSIKGYHKFFKIYNSLEQFFGWTTKKEKEYIYFCDNTKVIPEFELLGTYKSIDPKRHVVCFSQNSGKEHTLFSVKNKLYLIRKIDTKNPAISKNIKVEEIKIKLPSFSAIGGIISSGEDEYICVVYSGGDEESYISSMCKVSANIMFVNIGDSKITTKILKDGYSTVSELRRCSIKGPILVDDDYVAFSAGINFFILSRTDGTLKYKHSFFSRIREINGTENTIIVSANYEGAFYGLNIDKKR